MAGSTQKKRTDKKTEKPIDDEYVKAASLRAEKRILAKKLEAEAAEKLKKKSMFKTDLTAVIMMALSIFLLLSLFTNGCGTTGAATKKILFGLFGAIGWFIPFFILVLSILILLRKTSFLSWRLTLSASVLTVLLTTFTASFFNPLKGLTAYTDKLVLKDIYDAGKSSGGVIGVYSASFLLNIIGRAGLIILCLTGIVICVLFVLDTPLSQLFDLHKIRQSSKKESERIIDDKRSKEKELKKVVEKAAAGTDKEKALSESASSECKSNTSFKLYDYNDQTEIEQSELVLEKKNGSLAEFSTRTIRKSETDDAAGDSASKNKKDESSGSDSSSGTDVKKKQTKWKLPPIELLKKVQSSSYSNKTDFTKQVELLENTLDSFGVEAVVKNVVRGPSVTRFEVQPAPGVSVKRIVALQNDIALNLQANSIRIEAPIPGKAAVGIEVSNSVSETVFLRELLESSEFKKEKSKIAFALGRGIDGHCVICDIKQMPHLLIGGTTGSGKSVCINSMLVSLLYKATPDELRLILIDPKVVELTPFNGIPHLMCPVVTDPVKAAAALNWGVLEMENRYNKFADEKVKDLKSYNDSVRYRGEAELVMPEIVIVIDELNDLILNAKKQVETAITKLAEKARAAGIHLVLATQRPDSKVVTGIIKSNVPSRIALSVSSSINSKIILDCTGAEHLLGKGDLLYKPIQLDNPVRVQGPYISDEEVEKVIEFLKSQSESQQFDQNVINALNNAQTAEVSSDEEEYDEMFMDVLEYIVQAKQCSISGIQRKFRIGYNRAARIVDMLEERDLVGPSDGKFRKVLMNAEELSEYKERYNL